MEIVNISLKGFRNLEEIQLEPVRGMNIFYGLNAQGKTNFLESLYFCATGRSMRMKIDNQLIGFQKEESHLQVKVKGNFSENRIDVHLKKDEKKGIAVNGLYIRKLGDLFGTLYTVIFSPDDLGLVKEGPTQRRRFLDMELCQLDKVYYYNLQQYYKILKQRNHLLKQIQKKPELKETLFLWDQQLVTYGKGIMTAREVFLSRLDQISHKKMEDLTGGVDSLKTIYKPNCHKNMLAEKMEKSISKDIILGSTQYGPHKDDIIFLIDDKEVKTFGSQGQQRSTALATKLAQIDLIQEETGEDPVLLLDDVFSELDETRQQFLMNSISSFQSFITCTGIEDAMKTSVNNQNLFHVVKGNIIPQK